MWSLKSNVQRLGTVLHTHKLTQYTQEAAINAWLAVHKTKKTLSAKTQQKKQREVDGTENSKKNNNKSKSKKHLFKTLICVCVCASVCLRLCA